MTDTGLKLKCYVTDIQFDPTDLDTKDLDKN